MHTPHVHLNLRRSTDSSLIVLYDTEYYRSSNSVLITLRFVLLYLRAVTAACKTYA